MAIFKFFKKFVKYFFLDHDKKEAISHNIFNFKKIAKQYYILN